MNHFKPVVAPLRLFHAVVVAAVASACIAALPGVDYAFALKCFPSNKERRAGHEAPWVWCYAG